MVRRKKRTDLEAMVNPFKGCKKPLIRHSTIHGHEKRQKGAMKRRKNDILELIRKRRSAPVASTSTIEPRATVPHLGKTKEWDKGNAI
jgi:hypothetical protein